MTTTQKRHGKNLLRIYPEATEQDPIKLCKKLRRLEVKANQLATDHCNGLHQNEVVYYRAQERILDQVIKILLPIHADSIPFFNGDPIGYALKIEDKYVRDNNIAIERDWGGYGLIAPEIN